MGEGEAFSLKPLALAKGGRCFTPREQPLSLCPGTAPAAGANQAENPPPSFWFQNHAAPHMANLAMSLPAETLQWDFQPFTW